MSLLASGVLANPSTPYFGSGGGGGGSNTLNNGRRTTFIATSVTVGPGVATLVATTDVTATYDNSSPRYLPLCFAQLSILEVATTSPLTVGDTVTFYFEVVVDGGVNNSVVPGVTTPASALVAGYLVNITNSSGVFALVLPGAHTYTINLYVLYNSTGTATINLTWPRQGLITAQVLACAAPII
jgi:hypothetical protein